MEPILYDDIVKIEDHGLNCFVVTCRDGTMHLGVKGTLWHCMVMTAAQHRAITGVEVAVDLNNFGTALVKLWLDRTLASFDDVVHRLRAAERSWVPLACRIEYVAA